MNYDILKFKDGIFVRDYIYMSEIRTRIILEDLMKNALHPKRLIRFLELGGEIDDWFC
jgi:hypothetical protein